MPQLDPEIAQICTGRLSKSEECCSAVRLLCTAILKLTGIIETNAVYEMSALFFPVVHYTNISYDMIDFL